MSLARQLVERWRRVPYAAIPEGVHDAALLHLLAAIGVGVAAAATSAGRPYLRASPALNGSGAPATIFGLADGSAPAAAAFTKGWEILIRMGLAPGRFQAQGFQITSVGKTLAAALVAGDLIGLSTATSVDEIGIALSEALGVFEFLTIGSTVTLLHASWAPHAGIAAATFAGGALTGPATALEGLFGLVRRFTTDDAAVDRFVVAVVLLCETRHLPQAAFKFYPCCHYIHPFIEAFETVLGQAPGVAVDAVDREVPPGEALLIFEPWRKLVPQTGREARYSLPIALAARLIGGAVTLASFGEAPRQAVLAKASDVTARPIPTRNFPIALRRSSTFASPTATARTCMSTVPSAARAGRARRRHRSSAPIPTRSAGPITCGLCTRPFSRSSNCRCRRSAGCCANFSPQMQRTGAAA